jgi:hypothetical protein
MYGRLATGSLTPRILARDDGGVTPHLGVDIGGVIIQRTDDGDDTSFWGDNYLATPAVPGAFVALRRLIEGKFGDNVFIVSKSGEYTEKRAREWLEHHAFFDRSGVRRDNVVFCRRREEKAGIARGLGLTHFVDDRLDILVSLEDVTHRYLFGPTTGEDPPMGIRQVNDWEGAAAAIFVDGG